MEPLQLDALVQKVDQLPPLPDNCHRLQEVMDDPNATPSDMAGVIESDVGLASKVLRLANSAHCAIPGGVDSMQRAVCFLGFSTIHQIVLCMQSYQVLGSAGAPLPKALTDHALTVAGVAQQLCSRVGVAMPQRAFSAGLLHDLGRVALYVLFPDHVAKYLQAIGNGSSHDVALEAQVFGVDHQTVGALLARKWKYPDALIRVVEDHHGPGGDAQGKEAEQIRLLSDVVAVADGWSWPLGKPGIDAKSPPALDPARLQRTGLAAGPSEEDLATLQESLGGGPNIWS